jgi:2'-5' RNA ligase
MCDSTIPGMPSREDEHYGQAWAALDALAETRDHWWWRPGWRIGRAAYTWHITFEDNPALAELAGTFQSSLRLPVLDPVPAEGLHMTLQGVGFTDEVSDDDIGAIVERARVRCARLAPFEVTFGPAYADVEGVQLRVEPWDPVEQLRLQLRAAIGDIWGEGQVPEITDGFVPHVTVFYSNAIANPEPMRERLRQLRDTRQQQRITIRRVSLIRLNRDDKIYRWTVAAAVPLGPS